MSKFACAEYFKKNIFLCINLITWERVCSSKGPFATSNCSSILADEIHNCRYFPSFSKTDINQCSLSFTLLITAILIHHKIKTKS